MARFTYNPRTGVLSGLQGISIGTPAQTIEEFVTSYISSNTESVYDSDLVVATVLKNLDIAALSSLSGGGSGAGMTDSDLAVVAKLRNDVDSDSPVLQYLATQIENILARLDSDYALTKAIENKLSADIDSDRIISNTKFILQQLSIDSESAKVQALKERVYGLVADNDSDQVRENRRLRDDMDSDQAVQDARLFGLEVDLDSERSLLTFLRSFVFAYDPSGANIFNYYSSAGGFGYNPFHDSDLVIESAIKGFNVAAASYDSDRTVQTINKNIDVAGLTASFEATLDSEEVYNMGREHGWFYDSDKVMGSVTKNTVAIINIVNNNLGKVDSDFVFTMLDSEEVVNMFAEHGIATNTAITQLKADLDSETSRIQLLLSNADSDQIAIAVLRRDADSDSAVIQALKSQADLDAAYITLIRADLDSDTTAIQALRTDMDSESARVNARLSDIENDVNVNQASNTVQNNRLNSLEARADSDETVLQLLDGRVTTLENAVDDTGFDSDQVVAIINENVVNDPTIVSRLDSDELVLQLLDGRITTLESSGAGSTSARLDSDEAKLQTHSGRLDVLETRADSDETALQLLDGRITTLENQDGMTDSDLKVVADLRNDLDSDFTAFNTRITSNFNDIQTLNSTTNSQGGRITLLELSRDSESAKVQAIQGSIDTNTATLNAYGGRIASLESNEDSDTLVVNTLRSTVDSLRSDIDSETARIQLILLSQDSDALSLGALRRDADSDAAVIVVLKQNAESDSLAIQALSTTISPRLDSDEAKLQTHSGRLDVLETRADSDEIAIQNLGTSINNVNSRLDSDEIAISARLPLAGGTMSGDIDGNGNKVLFANVYSNEVDLPNATTYHGMFAHVHATGAGYFAHAGNWIKLANNSDITTINTRLDSDETVIQNLQTQIDNFVGIGDSDLAVVATLRNDVDNLRADADSDSIEIQALREDVDALVAGTYNDAPLVARLDSDTLAISALRNDVDSDSAKLQALETTVASLGGSQAINVTAFTFTSSANDSDFTGADDNGRTLSYAVNKIHVYLNGILLTDTTDYLATDGSTISLINAPDSDDVLTVIKFLGTVQAGFDSDQIVDIINENVVPSTGMTDSDLQVVADIRNEVDALRSDIDSETARIQLILLSQDSDSLSLANLKRDADSDAAAIVVLRQNAESDSLAIQALSSSLAPRLDSDELVLQLHSGRLDVLETRADSDELQLQAIDTTISTIQSRLDSDETSIQATRTEMDVSFNVTNNGASAYTFTGDGFPSGVDNPTLYLNRGHTYNFRVNASGHPFQIRLSSGGSAYSTGVSNNGAQIGEVKFVVPMDAPEFLVYQCTVHSGMVGSIKIGKQGFDSDQIASMIAVISESGMQDSDLAVVAKLRSDVDSDSIKLQALQETVDGLSVGSGFDSDQIVAIINENPTSSGTGMTDSDLKVVADLRNDLENLRGSGSVQKEVKFTTFKYKAVQGQSTFSGVDRSNQTLAYTVNRINVFINGVLINDSDDYVATNGTSVVLNLAADSDDVVVIQKHEALYDSEVIVAIMNENVIGMSDSDLKAVADLRNDLDSDRANKLSLSLSRFDYTATQGQTSFSGSDDNGNTLSYVSSKIQVFLNGILMLDTTDYTATNGTSVTLVTAADSDDKLSIIKYLGVDATVSDAINITRFTYKYGVDGNSVVGDSEITGGDEHGNTLSYTAGKIQVYSNGILLEDSDDYIATDGSTVTLRAAPDSDDVVSIFKYLGTTQSGFDSDQVVAIVNENSSGVTTGKAIAMAIVFGG